MESQELLHPENPEIQNNEVNPEASQEAQTVNENATPASEVEPEIAEPVTEPQPETSAEEPQEMPETQPEVAEEPAQEPVAEPAPAAEMLPVVEESGLVTGQASRENCHSLPQEFLHPVVHLHILDRFGNIYLQKRAPGKKL